MYTTHLLSPSVWDINIKLGVVLKALNSIAPLPRLFRGCAACVHMRNLAKMSAAEGQYRFNAEYDLFLPPRTLGFRQIVLCYPSIYHSPINN